MGDAPISVSPASEPPFHANRALAHPVETARPWKRQGGDAAGAGGSERARGQGHARLGGLARRETRTAGGGRASQLPRALEHFVSVF